MKKIALISIFLIAGCTEQQSNIAASPKAPAEKTPTSLDATRFCKIGSEFSELTYDLAMNIAEGYLAENNINPSYANTFAGGLLSGQLDVSSENLDSALSNLVGGGYSYEISNNSGTFVTGCVKDITSSLN